jgi:methionine sulfoxide reductase catalytic subunit
MGGVLLDGLGASGGIYYNAHHIGQMGHHMTMLAYNMNEQPLPCMHGKPLRAAPWCRSRLSR